MVGKFLMRTQKTILSAAFIISATYGISAILSLLRSRLLAHYFGAGEALAVFYTADKIPSFVYSLLVVGTISTVFIPVFTNLLKHDRKDAWETASATINMSLLAFGLLGLLAFIFAQNLINFISLGKFTAEQVTLGANLMRIMIVSQLVLIVSSFLTSLLQSFKYFILPALAPVFYNLGMIAGILFLTPKFGIYGPAYGVAIGSVLHFVIQLPLLSKIDFKYFFVLNFKDKGVREILKLVPPRILGSALAQVSIVVNNSLAILVSTSSVVIFKFADQLQSFPVNLFGASIALAALPTLSYEADGITKEKFKKTFLTSFHQMLYLVVPASVILLVLRVPMIRLIFGAKNFPWEATVQTSYTLAFFAISIFAQSLVYLLTRSFYALKDTATPVKVNFFTVLLSIALSLTFIKVYHFGVWSIALSYSIAAILDTIILLALLSKKVGGIKLSSILIPFVKISYSALFMGICLYVPLKLLDQVVFDTTRTVPLIFLTGIAGLAGTGAYLFFTWLFKVKEIELFYKLLNRLNVFAPPEVLESPQTTAEV